MSVAPTQSELLQWAVSHTTTATGGGVPGVAQPPQQSAQPQRIDPKWIEIILGKEDAVKMKECVEKIQSGDNGLDEKLQAFDELEMLVESLDNANDLEPLNLWKPIIDVLSSSSELKLRMYAAWVLGTAVQNNPKSQAAFLRAGGLGPVLRALESDTDSEVRAKALYCISGAIRHNQAVFDAFVQNNGFAILASVARDGDPRLLKRVMFLLRTLLHEEGGISERTAQAAQENGIPGMAVDIIAGEAEDADLVEKCLDVLVALATNHPEALSPELRQRIKNEVLPSVEERFGGDGALSSDLIQSLKVALKDN